MEARVGIEPAYTGNEIRTRDPNLGKVVLYQLSYSRSLFPGHCLVNGCVFYGLPFGRQ